MLSRCRIALALMALMAIACSCGTSKRAADQSAEEAIIADLQTLLIDQGACQTMLLAEALDWQGTPYRHGGADRRGVDCSAFVMLAYDNSLGIKLPRNSAAQAKHCMEIKKKDMVPGDLVFFNTGGRGVTHVGLYLGHGEFIHASSSQGVMISRLDHDYWSRRLVMCGRVPLFAAMLRRERRR